MKTFTTTPVLNSDLRLDEIVLQEAEKIFDKAANGEELSDLEKAVYALQVHAYSLQVKKDLLMSYALKNLNERQKRKIDISFQVYDLMTEFHKRHMFGITMSSNFNQFVESCLELCNKGFVDLTIVNEFKEFYNNLKTKYSYKIEDSVDKAGKNIAIKNLKLQRLFNNKRAKSLDKPKDVNTDQDIFKEQFACIYDLDKLKPDRRVLRKYNWDVKLYTYYTEDLEDTFYNHFEMLLPGVFEYEDKKVEYNKETTVYGDFLRSRFSGIPSKNKSMFQKDRYKSDYYCFIKKAFKTKTH